MARNPLAGLSRYINVEYDEPETNVVDSIFGTYSERMDRDIAKANIGLERERLRYNADLAQTQQQQRRIDTGRRNLNTDIINTLNVTKGLPYFMREKQVSGIASSYVDILGQDVVDEVVGVSNPLSLAKGDGYAGKSKANYETIQKMSSVKNPEELLILDSNFNYDADQLESFKLKRKETAQTIMRENPDVAKLWQEETGRFKAYDKTYGDVVGKTKSLKARLGLLSSGLMDTEENMRDRMNTVMGLESLSVENGNTWKDTEMGKTILANETFLVNADNAMLSYDRYKKNPFLFIKENIDMPTGPSPEILEIQSNISKLMEDFPDDVKLNLDLGSIFPMKNIGLSEEQIAMRDTEGNVDVAKMVDGKLVPIVDGALQYGSREELMSSMFPNTSDTTAVAQPDTMVTAQPDTVEADPLRTVDTDNILSNKTVEVDSGVYPSPKQMFDIMGMAESSGNPDSTRTNDNGTLDSGLVQINSSNVLEPGNEFGGKSNMIISEGLPGAGEPDPLWAKAQTMFKEEIPDWEKLDDAGKMEAVKNMTIQKKFFDMWYPVRPADFRGLPRAMELYNKNRPLQSLNQVSDVSLGNMSSDDVVRTELDSLGITAGGQNVEYNFEEASSDSTR